MANRSAVLTLVLASVSPALAAAAGLASGSTGGYPSAAAARRAAGHSRHEGRRIVQFRFRTAKAAAQKAEDLRRQGFQVTQSTKQVTVPFQTLQLRVYPEWADAERVAARVESHGIDALVINDSMQRGYAVAAGAFRTDRNVQKRIRRLQNIGFRSISIVPVQVMRTRYLVKGVRPPTTVASAPKGGKPKPTEGAAEQPQVMVFGGAPESYPGYPPGKVTAPPAGERKFRVGLDNARVEAGALTHSSQPVDASSDAHLAASARWRPSERWEYKLSGRVDGYLQSGTPDLSDARMDYGDSYIRYRSENMRVTAGAQTVIWGRVDEIPPTDRLSVQDVTRYVLDPLQDRRRSVPALRIEGFHKGYKLDTLWVPEFRPAQLLDRRSIWSPVDTTAGRLLGIPSSPGLVYLVENGTFGEDKGGQGGYGFRLSHTGERVDYAVTVQRARRSLPYYQLNEATRTTLLSTGNPAAALAAANGDTFVARHPMSWVFGGDVGFQAMGATWRFEAAYLENEPATTTDFRMITTKAIDWVAGVEFYPGNGNARVNLQLAGHHLIDAPPVLDLTHHYVFNGSVEDTFSHDRWRAKLRFWVGLDKKDIYLNPEIAYIGWEPNEFYIGAHYFDGAERTLNGFYKDDSLIVLGWRARY